MQKYLNRMTPENVTQLITALGPDVAKVMIDLYGNYFCQKLLQSSSSDQRILILNFISKEFINISFHSSGTHVLQTLIDIINLSEEEIIILNTISGNEIEMSYVNIICNYLG
jgi:hypothetical protein